MVSRTRSGFTLNIIDTPGLIEGGYVSDQILETIKGFESVPHHWLYDFSLLIWSDDFFNFFLVCGNECPFSFLGRFLLNKTIDVLLYVDRLDAYRVDNLDKQVVKAITESFGKEIWRKGVVVLTHAQLSPPDGLNYEEFFSKRSESLLKCVRQGARISKKEIQVCFYLKSLLMVSRIR